MTACCPTCGSRYATWTPQRILDAAAAWNSRYGHPPTANEWSVASPVNPIRRTVRRHFPSWDAMLRAAGLPTYPERRRAWTKEATLQAAFLWRFRHGRLPKSGEWVCVTADHPNRYRVRELFGSWNAMIVAAGYAPAVRRRSVEGYRRQAGAATRIAA